MLKTEEIEKAIRQREGVVFYRGYEEELIEKVHRQSKTFHISDWIPGHPLTEGNIKLMLHELDKCDYISREEHNKIHFKAYYQRNI